jgi:hypothetical protein
MIDAVIDSIDSIYGGFGSISVNLMYKAWSVAILCPIEWSFAKRVRIVLLNDSLRRIVPGWSLAEVAHRRTF